MAKQPGPVITHQAVIFKRIRKLHKKSQVDFGIELGDLPQSWISRYESGELNIPHEVVKALHDKFGMSYELFYNNRTAQKPEKNKPVIMDIKDLLNAQEQLRAELEFLKTEVNTLKNELYILKSSK